VRRTSLALLLLALTPMISRADAPTLPRVKPLHRGVALGLFGEDPGFDYQPLLKEIAATGATHVSVVVPYYMHDVRSVHIAAHPRFTPDEATVERTLRQASALRLKVLLFPILRLEYQVTAQEWRGTLRPRDPARWWRGYEALMLKFAGLAARQRAVALCVGSELGSMDTDPAPWAKLVKEVRRRYRGKLIYSANWDHYDQVRIWHLVDLAGLSAYFQLTAPGERPTLQRLTHSWREQRVQIERWLVRTGKPLIFTEVGYHSQRGTSAYPWDESADKPVSLQEQADCFRAFLRVWRGAPHFGGVYFWNWFGFGGPSSREYCPRGKPAAAVLCRWLGGEGRAGSCPTAWGMPWYRK
jgi:Glycoside Hydrolase Family 113